MTAVFIGPTDIIIAGLFPQQADEQVKAWRFHCYASGNYHYEPQYSNRIVYGARA